MQLPRWMVKVIDPPTGYVQDRSPRPVGPIFRGGAIFGPGVDGGARQATPEELQQMRAQAENQTPRRPATAPGNEVDPIVVRAAGNDLIEHGTTTVRADGREVTAHIVTFWHGDSLLEIVVHSSGRDQSSTTRISRKLTPSDLPMLTAYLTDALQAG